MPATQHRPGTITRIRQEPGLKGVNEAPCLVMDVGENRQRELVTVADEAAFWQTFALTLNVGGAHIRLNENCRPEPETLTKKLVSQPDSNYRRLQAFAAWLADVATPQQVLEVMRKLTQATP